MPFGCAIDLRSNNEPSRSQASLARGKACQPRQASQRMSAGPGSKIRALSTPVFSPFRGFSGRGRAVALFARGPQVWLRYGSVFRASDRGVRCAVSRCAKPVGCLPRPIVSAVFSAGVRGIGCVSFAAQGVCPVFPVVRRVCAVLPAVRRVCPVFSCRLPSLRRASCRSRSPLCTSVINSVHGRWTIDATCF